MRSRSVFFLSISPILAHAVQQEPLNAKFFESKKPDGYEFKWPVNNVAIVGAGVSGLIAYREFTRAGFSVRLFERDHVPGGNWHYTEETPLDAPVPNADPSVGDYVPSLPPPGTPLPLIKHYSTDWEAQWREHRAPKPVWDSLESNAPAPIQQIRELAWPPGTPWNLPHRTVARYLRAFASFHGANSNDANPDIAYNTRVELVKKRYDEDGQECGWTLTLKRLEKTGSHSAKATWWTEDFDAVVVATGRYNAPNIPSIPGLEDWVLKFPGTIKHSRQYRRPQPFINDTVLVVGAANSGVDISREVNLHAHKIYQSVRRNPNLPYEAGPVHLRRLPANISVVPEIRRFHACNSTIELVNGTFLSSIDHIIFATGFRYSFPFLPQFHNSSSAHSPSVPPIVTDGSHLRSLHEDFIYIEEPTIGFLSMNWGLTLQSFIYSEYLSVALSKVWSQKAVLPPTQELWRIYEQRVRERGGYGRQLQYLAREQIAANIRFFVGWLNGAAVKFGGRQIDGQSKDIPEIGSIWWLSRYGLDSVDDGVPNGTINALDWEVGEDW